MKKSKKKPRIKAKAKPAKNGRITSTYTDLSVLNKPQEYLDFILFIAIPRVKRQEIMDVETQGEFSKKYGVGEATLADWKKRAGFWDDVMAQRKEFFRQRTADVLLALETKSLDPKKVQGQDVKVLLTYTGEYAEKAESEHRVHPDIQKALEKISSVLG